MLHNGVQVIRVFFFFLIFEGWKLHRNSKQSNFYCIVSAYQTYPCHIEQIRQMVLITVFPSGVNILDIARIARRCVRSKKTTTLFKASALPNGFISHTFELRWRNKFLKFQIFLQAAWSSRRGVRLSSSLLLSFWGNSVQHEPGIPSYTDLSHFIS